MRPSARDPSRQASGQHGKRGPAPGQPLPGGPHPRAGVPFVRVLIVTWLAGLLLGAGAAAVGSLVAAAFEALAGPTWSGALDILLVGTLIGVVTGVPFLLFRARSGAGGRWLAAGWGVLVFVATVVLLPNLVRTAVVELSSVAVAAVALLLVLPFVAWGLALEKVAERLYFRPRRARRPRLELHSN